MKTITFCNKRK